MSKIYDVEKMYGQDFSIVTTNAPSNIIKNAKKLLPNTLLISSPQDDVIDEDNNMPSIFVTDYNAQPLQLTYPFYMKNGLNYHENGYVYLNIDNSTITTDNLNGSGKLKVNTDNLNNATFNNKGVVKLSKELSDIKRNLNNPKYDQNTFITINDDGILYIHNDIFDLINSIIDLKIKQKIDSIKIMLNDNRKMWIEITAINGMPVKTIYNTNITNSNPIQIDSNEPTVLTFNLNYLSFNNESETIQIIDKTEKLYSIEYGNGSDTTIVSTIDNNDELYQHTLSNITLIFLPNYFLVNNQSYKQELQLIINVDDVDESLIFQQNKLSDFNIEMGFESDELSMINTINSSKPVTLLTEKITSINGLHSYTYLDNNIIYYRIHTFIKNNVDDNNNYILFDINDYDISKRPEIGFFNIENGNNTRLYYFIQNIINPDESNNNSSQQYDIDINRTITDGDNELYINNFIIRQINNNSLDYYINLGVELQILTFGDKEIGKYTNITKIGLDLNRAPIYGFIFINGYNKSQNDILSPIHVYYNSRSGSNRYNVYSTTGQYSCGDSGQIRPEKLYCIYGDIDFEENNYIIKLPYTSFKTYDTKTRQTEDYNSDIKYNNYLDYFIENAISQDETKYISINLNGSGNNINDTNISNNILNMLYNGLSFNINYGETGIIKSQTVNLYINMLEILLHNLCIKCVDSSGANNITNENIINLSNDYVNQPKYYNMNNYVIKNTYCNNNNINEIYITIPNIILTLLTNSSKTLNMFLTFYGYNYDNENSSQYPQIFSEQIKFNKGNDNVIYANVENSQLSILGCDNKKDGNNQSIPNIFIIKMKGENQIFPKLLMIDFSIDSEAKKTCYIQDTISYSGGNLSYPNTSNNQLKSVQLDYTDLSGNIYYQITKCINDDSVEINSGDSTQNNTFITKILNPNGDNNQICINPLILTGFEMYFDNQNNIEEINNLDKFNLLLNDYLYINNDNNTNIKLGTFYKLKFKYRYLKNLDNQLSNYNSESGTQIDGSIKTISSNYQLKFNKISFNNLSENNNILYTYFSNTNNIIEIFDCNYTNNTGISINYLRNKIFSHIFNTKINNSETNISNNIDLYQNNEIIENNISTNDEYKLILNNYSIDNIKINELYLGYEIKYNLLRWFGIKIDNNSNPSFNLSINIGDNNINNIINNINLSDIYLFGTTTTNYTIKFKNDENELQDFEDVKNNISNLIFENHQNPNYSQQLIYNIFFSHGGKNYKFSEKVIIYLHNNKHIVEFDDDDLYFVFGNNETHVNSILLDAKDDKFSLYYSNNGNLNIKIINQNNVEVTGNDIPFTINTTTDSGKIKNEYSLKNDIENNKQYIIECTLKDSEPDDIYYFDKTVRCTINIQLSGYPEFNWSTALSQITDINNTGQLPNITINNYGEPTYSIENYDEICADLGITSNHNYIIDGNNYIITDLDCHSNDKKITLNDAYINNIKGKNINVKVVATLAANNQYLETSKPTILILSIPADPVPENQSGE